MVLVCCKGGKLRGKIKSIFMIATQHKFELIKKSRYSLTDPRTFSSFGRVKVHVHTNTRTDRIVLYVLVLAFAFYENIYLVLQ